MNPRDSLLIAQLSQATISFLGLLNRLRREDPAAMQGINRLLNAANYNPVNSLVHQGTLIGHAYLTIVWLWEKQAANFAQAIPNFAIANPTAPWPNLADTVLLWESGSNRVAPRDLHNWLRHTRNALGHGRVAFDASDDDALVFSDSRPDAVEPHTRIRIESRRLFQVADCVVQACEHAAA